MLKNGKMCKIHPKMAGKMCENPLIFAGILCTKPKKMDICLVYPFFIFHYIFAAIILAVCCRKLKAYFPFLAFAGFSATSVFFSREWSFLYIVATRSSNLQL